MQRCTRMWGWVAGAALLIPAWLAAAPEAVPDTSAAVNRALPLIRKSAAEYTRQRSCFSCHHQAMGVLALTTARRRGYTVADEEIQAQVRHTQAFLSPATENYRKGQGQGGQADTAGYALLTLELGGVKPDATTAAVDEYLLGRTVELPYWRPQSSRPPSEQSNFTPTYLALRALHTYGTAEQKERIQAREAKVREWLVSAPVADTEDRVFRLQAYRAAGVTDAQVSDAVADLVKLQREDGGWSQTSEMQSDAYATGSVLFALLEAGKVPSSHAAVRRGVRYLLDTQQPDGSWHVVTRSRPIQAYFETGFPHAKDQFVSMAGTCWATAALALAGPLAKGR